MRNDNYKKWSQFLTCTQNKIKTGQKTFTHTHGAATKTYHFWHPEHLTYSSSFHSVTLYLSQVAAAPRLPYTENMDFSSLVCCWIRYWCPLISDGSRRRNFVCFSIRNFITHRSCYTPSIKTTNLLFATRVTYPVKICPCFTRIGCCNKHRTWYQCVNGSVGAVLSQTGFCEPANSTSNQKARPWHVPVSRMWNSSGISRVFLKIIRILNFYNILKLIVTHWCDADRFRQLVENRRRDE